MKLGHGRSCNPDCLHLPAFFVAQTSKNRNLSMKDKEWEMLETLVRVCRRQAERLESMEAVQKSMSVKIDRLEIILGQPDRLKDIKKQARADRNREVSELVQEHYHTV